jgi:hypothetical protein
MTFFWGIVLSHHAYRPGIMSFTGLTDLQWHSHHRSAEGNPPLIRHAAFKGKNPLRSNNSFHLFIEDAAQWQSF